jgi:hypothetical protein
MMAASAPRNYSGFPSSSTSEKEKQVQTRRMDDSQRRHGFTTLQMQQAPKGALFIWPVSGSIGYAKDLAKHLGRDDLRIMSGSVLDNRAEKLRGFRVPAIVLDHACEPTGAEYELLRELRSTICREAA